MMAIQHDGCTVLESGGVEPWVRGAIRGWPRVEAAKQFFFVRMMFVPSRVDKHTPNRYPNELLMSDAARAMSISELAAMMEAVQDRDRGGSSTGNRGNAAKSVETGWGEIARRASHEWFADAPPLAFMIDLIGHAMEMAMHAQGTAQPVLADALSGGAVFWMGRACWPYPQALAQASGNSKPGAQQHQGNPGTVSGGGLLERSIFVDLPADRAVRVWAIDLVLRSRATLAVVADGRGIDMAQSRRLQLAAEAGHGLAMFWRKPEERAVLSVAHHRWRVSPVPTQHCHPRWEIERLRCKDAAAWNRQGLPGGKMTMIVEQRGAPEGIVAVSADVADRPPATAARPGPIIINTPRQQRDRPQRRTG